MQYKKVYYFFYRFKNDLPLIPYQSKSITSFYSIESPTTENNIYDVDVKKNFPRLNSVKKNILYIYDWEESFDRVIQTPGWQPGKGRSGVCLSILQDRCRP